mgnify:CR=1 FL=1
MTRVPLEDRMPAIREKLMEIQEGLSDLTWEERDDYFIFLHSLNMTIKYSNGETGR